MRLDIALTKLPEINSRSQANSLIRMGKVTVDGRTATKPGQTVDETSNIDVDIKEKYVSRAGNKLASVATILKLDFNDKTVLDVGSSTGGFTDFALQHGAKKVIAIDVGTEQLHPSLRADQRIELHEKTDIRNVFLRKTVSENRKQKTEDNKNRIYLKKSPDIVVIDVSFISLREILPSIANLLSAKSQIVAMLKPQFEAGDNKKHKGVIKNSAMRRAILKDFEQWAKQRFVIQAKQDSDVLGRKGNQERFYLLKAAK
ncbi:TPA: TlyA family RNA methyltransferase [Candidatus Saccharibacteria bacterium]|nr:TlyA family RNA methyltransferase [Candidatus Saccharibacteria bacterium]HIO87732.1 TlyA family RNA methyltransferase [Candidatus Saccharibacteria bacterium]